MLERAVGKASLFFNWFYDLGCLTLNQVVPGFREMHSSGFEEAVGIGFVYE